MPLTNTLATADLTQLSIGEESSFATAASAAEYLRTTGDTLTQSHEYNQSEELLARRDRTDSWLVSQQVEGSVNFELSYGMLDTILQGVFCNTWDTDQLINGDELHSYSIWREYTDITSTVAQFLGCFVNTLDFEITPGQAITGSFGVLGKAQSMLASHPLTPTDAPTNPVFNSGNHVTSQAANGASITATRIQLQIANNIRARNALGSFSPIGFALGSLDITGTLQTRFEDDTLLDLFLNDTALDLEFTIDDAAGSGNSYAFVLPNIRFTSGPVTPSRRNTDIFAEFGFRAHYGGDSDDYSIQVTRASA